MNCPLCARPSTAADGDICFDCESQGPAVIVPRSTIELLARVAEAAADRLDCNCTHIYGGPRCEGTCTHHMAVLAVAALKDCEDYNDVNTPRPVGDRYAINEDEENPPATDADARAFVAQVARLLKDGESAPGVEGDGEEEFELTSDDAVETLHNLISWARRLQAERNKESGQ